MGSGSAIGRTPEPPPKCWQLSMLTTQCCVNDWAPAGAPSIAGAPAIRTRIARANLSPSSVFSFCFRFWRPPARLGVCWLASYLPDSGLNAVPGLIEGAALATS